MFVLRTLAHAQRGGNKLPSTTSRHPFVYVCFRLDALRCRTTRVNAAVLHVIICTTRDHTKCLKKQTPDPVCDDIVPGVSRRRVYTKNTRGIVMTS